MLVKHEAVSTTTTVDGTTEQILPIRNLRLRSGRFFTDEENRTLQRVAVLGATVAGNLFDGRDPVGETVRIGKVAFEVIGVLDEKGTDLRRQRPGRRDLRADRHRAAPALQHQPTSTPSSSRPASSAQHRAAAAEVAAILRERHRLGGKPDDFTIQSQTEILKTEQETSQTFTNLLERGRGDLAARRRRRHPRGHADGDQGAHPRDRRAPGRGRAAPGPAAAVRRGVAGAERQRRRGRHPARGRALARRRALHELADEPLAAGDRGRVRLLRRRSGCSSASIRPRRPRALDPIEALRAE